MNDRQKGLVLIEAIVALALIGLITAGFLGAVGTSYKSTAMTMEMTTAESLARSQLECVKNQVYDFNSPPSYVQEDVESTEHPGYFISVSVEPLHDPDDGIQEITVTVSYHDKEIKLKGYKRNTA